MARSKRKKSKAAIKKARRRNLAKARRARRSEKSRFSKKGRRTIRGFDKRIRELKQASKRIEILLKKL